MITASGTVHSGEPVRRDVRWVTGTSELGAGWDDLLRTDRVDVPGTDRSWAETARTRPSDPKLGATMNKWITRPPEDDWHLLETTSPGGSLLVSSCGRNFETDTRDYRTQTDPLLVPERRRCPACQGAYMRSRLP